MKRVSFHSCAILLLTALAYGIPAGAWELWSDEETGRYVTLRPSLKWTGLAAHNPDAPLFFPEEDTATGLFRARLTLKGKLSDRLQTELAYEHRMQWASAASGTGAAGQILPSFLEAPYRLSQLDWSVTSTSKFTWRHEVDRALLDVRTNWGTITVGRQAIGMGRGTLFSAVDVFAPFSPTEVDREWRRGVDALRVEYRTTPTSSVELIAAGGRSWDDSALLFRARGYIGEVDGEVIVGKRGEDHMYAVTASAIVGGAEVHGELALFDIPEEHPDGGLFDTDGLMLKAVLGSSYTFDVGNGLTLLGEYHYSGFGVKDIDDAVALLADESYQKRFLRGDAQILSRHALGMSATYPFNQAWTGTLLALFSPGDGSGLLSPAVQWDFSRSASLRANLFLPWGREPDNGRIRSEYGATPVSLFVQLSMYF